MDQRSNGRRELAVGVGKQEKVERHRGETRRHHHGKAVARVGDSTDHEGILENGDASWMIN